MRRAVGEPTHPRHPARIRRRRGIGVANPGWWSPRVTRTHPRGPTPRARGGSSPFWYQPRARRYVTESGGRVVGAYFTEAQPAPGRGSHVANAAYLVATQARGRASGAPWASIRSVRHEGSWCGRCSSASSCRSNVAAVRLWSDLGFATIATLPAAFRHPTQGFVDALVMFRIARGRVRVPHRSSSR